MRTQPPFASADGGQAESAAIDYNTIGSAPDKRPTDRKVTEPNHCRCLPVRRVATIVIALATAEALMLFITMNHSFTSEDPVIAAGLANEATSVFRKVNRIFGILLALTALFTLMGILLHRWEILPCFLVMDLLSAIVWLTYLIKLQVALPTAWYQDAVRAQYRNEDLYPEEVRKELQQDRVWDKARIVCGVLIPIVLTVKAYSFFVVYRCYKYIQKDICTFAASTMNKPDAGVTLKLIL